MKKIVLSLLIIAAAVSVSLYGQTATVNVVSDLTNGTEGNLNTAISNVINADPTGAQLSNTVFKLEAYGYYILTGTITTPRGSHLYLEGPTPGATQQTAPPQIAWSNSGGVTTTFNFDCGGDFTAKNIWFLSARSSGAQVGTSIVFEDDSLANLSGKGENAWFDGCIFDYNNIGNGGGAIEPSCRHFRGHITNCYFRNMTDPHYRYYGRPVSYTYQSTTWHTDTLMFENCTVANCGYVLMQESPEYGDYISFNHCTFAQTLMFTFESSYWWWMRVTNCVFLNIYLYGDIPSGDGANQFGNGGLINVDSVATFGFTVPFSDSSTVPASLQRHILIANNSYGHEKWYTDYLSHNPYNPPGDTDKIHRMPAMSGKTLRFFIGTTNGKKNFPFMNLANLYPAVDTTADLPVTYNAAVDPGFILNPCNVDSTKAQLLGRWSTGVNVSWAFDPNSDVQQSWPMNEDLSYTNATLKTAAMSGYPLGDLFHWWPSKYTAWLAQATQERTNILNMQTNGITGVEQSQAAIPLTYELGQNYPNPFNPTTNIKFKLPVRSDVRLVLMNILGQEVKVIAAGSYEAGSHTVTLDASSLASGVYFYKLQTGKFSDAKKLVILK
jgi:hypothetical protein